jgi:hypothetical protein
LSSGSWLSPVVLARLKGQAPSAQVDALLLSNGVEQQQSVSLESRQGDDVPALGDDDPNKNPDPDELRSAEIDPPPAQPERWWTALVLGRESDAVSAQDAETALKWVAYRLGRKMPPEVVVEISQHGTMTVGELHTTIEECYGKPGWTTFVECWRAAGGIVQPLRSMPQSRCSEQNTDGKPVSAQHNDGVTRSGPIHPGLLAALPGMPRRLANWMLAPDSEPSAWRTETVSQREQREDLESIGGWPG